MKSHYLQWRASRGALGITFADGWVYPRVSETLPSTVTRLSSDLSMSEEFTLACTGEVLQYRDSYDQAGINVRIGRKWRAVEAVDLAESRLRNRVLMEAEARGSS